jgi:hypothetical protein
LLDAQHQVANRLEVVALDLDGHPRADAALEHDAAGLDGLQFRDARGAGIWARLDDLVPDVVRVRICSRHWR